MRQDISQLIDLDVYTSAHISLLGVFCDTLALFQRSPGPQISASAYGKAVLGEGGIGSKLAPGARISVEKRTVARTPLRLLKTISHQRPSDLPLVGTEVRKPGKHYLSQVSNHGAASLVIRVVVVSSFRTSPRGERYSDDRISQRGTKRTSF